MKSHRRGRERLRDRERPGPSENQARSGKEAPHKNHAVPTKESTEYRFNNVVYKPHQKNRPKKGENKKKHEPVQSPDE